MCDLSPGLAGKLQIIYEPNLMSVTSEVLVHFCSPNIYMAANDYYFEQLIEMTNGEWLATELGNYYGAAAGQVKLIDISATNCLKRLAITLLSSDLSSSEAIFDLYQSYRNALDRAAEEGFQTLAFIHPTMSHLLGELAVIRTALSTIGDWLGTSYYRDQVKMVTILCDDQANFERYQQYRLDMVSCQHPFDINPALAVLLESGEVKMEDKEERNEALMIEQVEMLLRGVIHQYLTNSLLYDPSTERDAVEIEHWKRLLLSPEVIQAHQKQLYVDLFRPNEVTEIQLSSRLLRRILLVEEERSGLVWKMRYTRAQGDHDDTLHFVCISCEAISRRTGFNQRCLARVINGVLIHNPEDHHPECMPVSKSHVIMVQLQRRLQLQSKIPGRQTDYYDNSDDDEDDEKDEEDEDDNGSIV